MARYCLPLRHSLLGSLMMPKLQYCLCLDHQGSGHSGYGHIPDPSPTRARRSINGSSCSFSEFQNQDVNGSRLTEEALHCRHQCTQLCQLTSRKGVHQFRFFLSTMRTPNCIVTCSCMYAFFIEMGSIAYTDLGRLCKPVTNTI